MMTIQDLRAESNLSKDVSILLDENSIERALTSRLGNPPETYPQWPIHYLIGCYVRVMDESRSISMLKNADDQRRLSETLTLVRQLIVSYAGFILNFQMFPQPNNAEIRGHIQLLDALYKATAPQGMAFINTISTSDVPPLIPKDVENATQIVPMPLSFLEDLAIRFADDNFPDMLLTMVQAIIKKLSSMSILADYNAPVNVFEVLACNKVISPFLVNLDIWLPKGDGDGRAVEYQTILGVLFGVSGIPDLAANPLHSGLRVPDSVDLYFKEPNLSDQGSVRSAIQSLHAALRAYQTQLHRIMMALLRNSTTRDSVLNWLTAAVRNNQERAKMRPDIRKTATDGFMLNLVAVMLKMCEPFIDPVTGKAWDKLVSRYMSDPGARGRCFDDDTRLAATSDEVAAWMAKQDSNNTKNQYHFICEIFFLTGMALRLGFSKVLETCSNVARSAHHYAQDAEHSPDPRQAMALRTASSRLKGISVAIEVSYKEDGLLEDVSAYYRLLTAYLIRLASPTAAMGEAPTLPLPEPVPMEYASLPEFFVEDVCSALTWTGRVQTQSNISPVRIENFMLFFTVFMGSPSYVKNPYLRGKMVEALASYMPSADDDQMDGWSRRSHTRGVRATADEVATLFQVHPLVIGHMIRSLISLFIDIERTDRQNTFYEKFNMRYHIGEVMGYLWKLPQHRAAWRHVAENDPKVYIRFVNFILADSQHLLQEALNALPEVQATEKLMDDETAWAALTDQERQERTDALEQHRRVLQSDFSLAEIYLRTMKMTSEDSIVATRFFDVQVRNRQARILNFFLRYLTLPAERRRLKLKSPERYGWRPRELIASLASIHVNLYRIDNMAWCDAVAADTDYYGPNPEIFQELIGVLRSLGLASSDAIADLEALAAGAAAATANANAEEEAFDDVPEEFEDPLLGGIMYDPVQLPSHQIVNRATILQQLLADPRDPFSRAPMSEEDLVECPELKARVASWVAQQRAKKKAMP